MRTYKSIRKWMRIISLDFRMSYNLYVILLAFDALRGPTHDKCRLKSAQRNDTLALLIYT